jgi:pimeloyl-ACP methyl ester carboxylesterase
MADWSDGYWETGDGLKLHYRDYAGPATRPPIICIPGLTRNARDFEGVADRLAGDWRVLCVELRGRGESAYAKDPMSYVPLTYLQDMEGLVAHLGLARFVLIGTSLGGLITMLMAMTNNKRIAGALLNDVGPVLDMRGLDRIRAYVGKPQNWPTWLHAARSLAEAHGDIYPDWRIEDWLVYAKRVARVTQSGRIALDYDMRIAEPFKAPPPGEVDLWPAFRSLKTAPLTLIHGALSDLVSPETIARMKAEAPKLAVASVPQVGHAPTLDEPESVKAIEALLKRVAGNP